MARSNPLDSPQSGTDDPSSWPEIQSTPGHHLNPIPQGEPWLSQNPNAYPNENLLPIIKDNVPDIGPTDFDAGLPGIAD